MSDALAQVEKRLLGNSGSSCGAAWLCPDELGSGFTFLEDREAGREKLIRMVNQQVTYLQFLMSKLPVETIKFKIRAGYEVSDQLAGCVPSSEPIAFTKHEEAAKFFFLGINQLNFSRYKDVDGLIKNLPSQATDAFDIFIKDKLKNWSAESVVDSMIKNPLTTAQIAQRKVFFEETRVDDAKVKAADKETNSRWLCFPMGNDVPLRQIPLSLDEIKAFQSYIRQSGNTLKGENEQDLTPEELAKFQEGGFVGATKITYYRSNYYPKYTDNTGGIVQAKFLPDCVKYKMIADFPYDVFGWKTDAKGLPSINLAMNDLFNEYLKYLGNPDMSFDAFRNNMPIEPVLGESGNPVPAKCLTGDCEEWEKQGFANYEQWAAFIAKNQSSNLTPGDVELVSGINMNDEFKQFFEKAYVNYATNPEFMPVYQQIIKWEFSNSCLDNPNYMTIFMIVDKNKNQDFYFTQEAYNYIISILVKARFETFIRKLLDAKWEAHYSDLFGEYTPSGPLWTDTQASRDYTYIIQHSGEELAKIFDLNKYKKPELSDYSEVTKESDLSKALRNYNAQIDKLKSVVRDSFLLPEDTEAEVNITFPKVKEFILAIANIYEVAEKNISTFNINENNLKQEKGARTCLEQQKGIIEGVPMTEQQKGDYRSNLARIIYNNWEEIARTEFEKYEKNFHDAIDNAEWVRDHKVLNWFRDNVFLNDYLTPILDLAVSGSMISDTGIMIFAGLFISNPISLFMMGLTLSMINTTWKTMAPPGSVYHHEPPLPDNEILSQYGIQLGLAIAGEVGGRIVAGLVPIIFNISAAILSNVLAKIQRGLGLLCEDSETILKNIANNKAAFDRFANSAADSGFSEAYQKFNLYRSEVENTFRFERADQVEALALKKQLQDSIAQNIEALEARGGFNVTYEEFNSLLKQQQEIERRIKGIVDEIASADKAVDYQRVAVLRNQLAIETASMGHLSDEIDVVVNQYNQGARKNLVDNEDIAYKKMKKLEEDLKVARDENNIDLANNLQNELENATRQFNEAEAALEASFSRDTINSGDLVELNVISDSQQKLAELEMKTNDDFFRATDAYQKEISELGEILNKAAEGNAASSQIARLASDIQKSKGTLEIARLYYDKAKQALLDTNPEEIGLFAAALENYEKTAKNYWDAVENQFFYSNMSALSLSFVSTWPDPTILANAGAFVLRAFVAGFTSEVGGYFQSWVDRTVLNTAYIFGLEAIAQTSNSIITVISHHYGNIEYKKLDIPNFGEDYPILAPNTESPAFNIELYRLRHDYIEPLLETYILINAMLQEIAAESKKSNTIGFMWHKYYDAWMEKYQTEEAYKQKYPNVPYTLKDFIVFHEAPRFKVTKKEFYDSNKKSFERYVDPFDTVWKAREERTAAYINFSYLLMDKYSGIQWTNEELAKFPPSTLPDYITPPDETKPSE